MSEYPTKNIELCAKDEEIERLRCEIRSLQALLVGRNAEIIRLQADAKRWNLLLERYPNETSSYPLIDELIEEAE